MALPPYIKPPRTTPQYDQRTADALNSGLDINFSRLYNAITNVTTGGQGPTGPPGATGTSITNVMVNSSGHLILTLSDGSTIDAGAIVTSSTPQIDQSLIATGTTAGGALQLQLATSVVNTVPIGSGVALPAISLGIQVYVVNNSSTQLLVYGSKSGSININKVAYVELPANTMATFIAIDSTNWFALGTVSTAQDFTVGCNEFDFVSGNVYQTIFVGGTTHVNLYYDPASWGAQSGTAVSNCQAVIAHIETAWADLVSWFGVSPTSKNNPSRTRQDPSGTLFNIISFNLIGGGRGRCFSLCLSGWHDNKYLSFR